MTDNPFASEWRECLEAHYMHVIRTRDRVTEPSLTVVMGQAGFNSAELAELRVRATMHVDDVGEDFLPDMDVLAVDEPEAEAVIVPGFSAPDELIPDVPASEMSPDVMDEAQEIIEDEPEAEPTPDEPYSPDLPKDDPDAPKQLSFF